MNLNYCLHGCGKQTQHESLYCSSKCKSNEFNKSCECEAPRVDKMLDLVIVGAGPHALSLVTRLLEKSPFSILSDQEHQRLNHIGNKNNKRSPFYPCCDALDPHNISERVLVIDKFGDWLKKWDLSFEAFGIQHLRSPIFFHPDPFHPDALKSFAVSENRESELFDITNVINSGCKHKKGTSRSTGNNFNLRDREQFFTPSTKLFSDFCLSLIDRYFLHDLVKPGWVTDIDRLSNSVDGTFFKVTYNSTSEPIVVYAKNVVMATGNTNVKSIPDWVSSAKEVPQKRIAHSFDFIECLKFTKAYYDCSVCKDHDGCINDIIPRALVDRMKQPGYSSKVLIVGGGLTSAQLVVKAFKRGFTEVVLISRSKLKTMQFDLSLDWVGRNNTSLLAKFWMESSNTARLLTIKNARNGGSITPEYMTILRQLQQSGKKLTILEKTEVHKCVWCNSLQKLLVAYNSSSYELFDQVWLGTGGKLDISNEPCLQPLLEKVPIQVVGGYPVLTNDLKWKPDVNLYVMGSYSSLSIGPTAGNLFGGRVAADRIASDLLEKSLKVIDSAKKITGKGLNSLSTVNLSLMAANYGNYWEALSECC